VVSRNIEIALARRSTKQEPRLSARHGVMPVASRPAAHWTDAWLRLWAVTREGPGTAILCGWKRSPWPHGQRLTGLMRDCVCEPRPVRGRALRFDAIRNAARGLTASGSLDW